jgi:cell wall-associated NlpC family hydrolase
MPTSERRPAWAGNLKRVGKRRFGAGAALFQSMQRLGTDALWRNRAVLICSALLVFLGLPDAQAKTARHRKRTAFSVALQPFSLVHSVVHAVAAPALDNAPRILRATATAPLRAAFYKQRRVVPRLPRATRIEDYEREDKRDGGAQPIRVAYQSARRTPRNAPGTGSGHDYDQEYQEQDNERGVDAQIDRRGDRPTVEGKRAVVRNGIAYAPSRAPENVKNAIWAANTLYRKPYVWGGGHGSFHDHGYDCSGSVSYALHGAGLLAAPLPSSDLMRYGERGRGRWITVYARPGHTFAVIAGLRFDTTDLGRGGDVGPRWYADGRDTRGYAARHPAGF